MITINDRELVGLHLLLKANEMKLDRTLQALLGKTERILYQNLSVEQLENLSDLYTEKSCEYPVFSIAQD